MNDDFLRKMQEVNKSMKAASEIFQWFMKRGLDDPTNSKIGHTKIQKLLFLAWLIHFQKFEKSLFSDDFFAFPNGEVAIPAYYEYKDNYTKLSQKPLPEFDTEELETLRLTEEIFGDASYEELIALGHNSPAWQKYISQSAQEHDINPYAPRPRIPKEELTEELTMIETVLFAYENMCNDS